MEIYIFIKISFPSEHVTFVNEKCMVHVLVGDAF